MTNLLQSLKDKVFRALKGQAEAPSQGSGIDNKIALGVLLWAVAESDSKFLPQERDQIGSLLKSYIRVSDQDLPIIMNTIEIAAIERIDLQQFTREVGKDISMPERIEIIENLFRVACIDNNLADEEHETIRQISQLFWVEHNDFIEAKVRIKKEFQIDTID